MTCTVSSGTLNPCIPYHTMLHQFVEWHKKPSQGCRRNVFRQPAVRTDTTQLHSAAMWSSFIWGICIVLLWEGSLGCPAGVWDQFPSGHWKWKVVEFVVICKYLLCVSLSCVLLSMCSFDTVGWSGWQERLWPIKYLVKNTCYLKVFILLPNQ